jgi:hypothetical protein
MPTASPRFSSLLRSQHNYVQAMPTLKLQQNLRQNQLNGAKILDYPHLWRWLCRVYALPGVADANSLVHCRQGYFGRSWNNVVPLGPFSPMSYPDAYLHPELSS